MEEEPQNKMNQQEKKKKYVCRVSQLIFETLEEYQTHLRSDLYRFNLKRKAASLAPVTQGQWESILLEKAMKGKKEQKLKSHIKSKNVVKNERKKKRNLMRAKELENKRSEEEGKSVDELIEEYIQDKKPLEITQSLFCDHVSADLESNLGFMRFNYGFYIPFRDYCTDVEGLIKYLGEKIGVGYTSIYDNMQFQSVEACQMHMRDTDTCRMLWENNENEFEPFYNYKALVDKELNMSKVEIHENGYELIVNNEKLLGHRQLAIYYKQGVKFTPPENKLIKLTNREDNIKKQKRVNVERRTQQRIQREQIRKQMQTNNQRYYRPDNPL